MEAKSIKIALIVLLLSSLVIPQVLLGPTSNQALAEEPPPEPPFDISYPGRIAGTGTFFEITNSESANITLTSTQEVKVVLESIPRMIILIIEAAGEGTDNTVLTLEGLEPNKTYYKYEDDFGGGSAFVSDGNGSHAWTQDLIQLHLVWIQEEAATISIPEQASTYGTWDEATRTFTLEQDLTETVWITEGNITLDGNGHTVRGTGSGWGIFSSFTTDVIVKNFSIEEFGWGFAPYSVTNFTLSNNTISTNEVGIMCSVSSNSNINSNNVLSNGWGILITIYSSNITVNDNIVSNQRFDGIWVTGVGCHSHNIRNNTISNNQLGVFVYFPGDSNNRIYHNSFIDNVETPQADVAPWTTGVLFDDGYPSGGNYWSDYIGVDLYSGPNQNQPESDGIGDTPYIINDFQDGYPLMFPPTLKPEANFDWSPEDPGPGENITFDASSSAGEIVSYNWIFGDNTTGTGENVTHAYQNTGNYTVTLTVSDNVGATDNISKTVSVQPWSFAIITDLHIGRGYPDYAGSSSNYSDENITGSEPELDYYLTERLNSAVNWIIANKGNPNYNIHFVAVLGDIADTAERSELLKAKYVLDRLNDPNGDGNTEDGIPYVPLFGNHDIWPYTDYERASSNSSVIGKYFEEIFWKWDPVNNKNFVFLKSVTDNFTRQEDEYQGYPYFQNYAFRYKGMNFLGLDFVERRSADGGVLPGAENFEETDNWTSHWLTEYKNEHDGQGKEPVVFLSHHPLIPHKLYAFNHWELEHINVIMQDYENSAEGKQFLGNFAGHVHGYEEALLYWVKWEDANREYAPHPDFLVITPVVTTEALMVGSNREDGYLENHNKGIIRIVNVIGDVEIDYDTIEGRYNPSTGEGTQFIALNLHFYFNNDKTYPTGNITVSFYPEAFTQRDINYRWDFGDGTIIETGANEVVSHNYTAPDTYRVTLTAIDNVTSFAESFPSDIPVEANVISYTVATSDKVTATSTTTDQDSTQVGRSQKDTLLIGAIHSGAKPVGLITVHFEEATQDIDLTAMVADYDFVTQKSVMYMPTWLAEVEESKILFIPYSQNGTIYVCPQATSLDEVNPHCTDKVILEPGESVNGMTAVPITYDDQQYYLVLGFVDGGGGVNLPPLANTNGPYVGEEGSPITFAASNSSDPNGDPLQYRWDFNSDGIWDTGWLTDTTVLHTWYDDHTGNVTLEAWDGELADTTAVSVNIINVSPTISEITAPLDPLIVGTEISANATFTDPGTYDTHVAIWDWGDNTTSDGYIDETVGFVSGNHTYTTDGVYTIRLTVTDDDSGSDESIFYYVVVYDPEGGFVTGGGWINSPEGAYAPDPTLTGKANLGFVSKYQQGQSTPSGNTQFNFKAGDLNFHSSSYDWLVIANHKAMYKGTGTVNGEGNYGFLLTAIDEALTPSTDVDLFRIKIWDKATGEVIYDNQMGDEEDADPITELGGGSIVIHEG